MKEGIFHDRLKGKPRDGKMVKLRRNVRNKFRTVVVAHVLKLHIKGNMGHFILDGADQSLLPKVRR